MSGHPTYDRIVFTFKNTCRATRSATSRSRSRRTAPGRRSTSTGDAVLSIRMEPASGLRRQHGRGRASSTRGRSASAAIETGTKGVKELVRTGDFEAVLTWVAGLPAKVPFSVSTEDDPPRLVVDVQTP